MAYKVTRFQSHLYGIESRQQSWCRRDRRRFNRTFMELKAISSAPSRGSQEGFNRTFMELKEEIGNYDL